MCDRLRHWRTGARPSSAGSTTTTTAAAAASTDARSGLLRHAAQHPRRMIRGNCGARGELAVDERVHEAARFLVVRAFSPHASDRDARRRREVFRAITGQWNIGHDSVGTLTTRAADVSRPLGCTSLHSEGRCNTHRSLGRPVPVSGIDWRGWSWRMTSRPPCVMSTRSSEPWFWARRWS